jgi:hypothetical protein
MTNFHDRQVLQQLIGCAWVEAWFGNAIAKAVVESG